MESTFIQYKLIYNTYKKNSKLIHTYLLKNKKIIDIYENINSHNKDKLRKELLKIITPIYKNAKKYGVEQLHFHLKNNESFLRMHKLKKFGDDLSDIRYSVAYVNKKHKFISGFEQGRIFHGYRYVYPIKNSKGEHLGSVELSIGSKAFEEMFENTLFVNSNFIINKKISEQKVFKDELYENYEDSMESPLYIQRKEQAIVNKTLLDFINKNITEYQKMLSQKLKTKKAFAIEVHTGKGCFIESFIPVKNIKDKKVIAYFITSNESIYFENLHKDTLILKIMLFFFTLMIVYMMHKNLNYSAELRNKIKQKTHELQESQKKVVQAEKMASLGILVAGVAHEINTPIGLSITAITNLLDETKILKSDYDNQTMDETEFKNYLTKSTKTADIIFINLIRTAELIKNFKQLSINQNLSDIIQIDVKLYVESLLISLDSKLKEKNVKVITSIKENIQMNIYADSLSQILNNFISNSLTHAFLNINEPTITIKIKQENDKISITYSDNGVGMTDKNLKKIFDPFHTTNRGAGNSGLGMHIVYNLIIDKLAGNIKITSEINSGVQIYVTLPTLGK
jgi:signal transduction histidine kinase